MITNTYIPEWWSETTLGKVVGIQPGFAFKSWDFSSNNWFPVIKIKNIQPPFIKLEPDDLVVIDNYSTERLSKFEVKNWEYLIAMTGETIWKVWKYNLWDFAYINQRVCKVVKSDNSDYRFIYYSLLQESFQKFIDTHSFGAAQANISTTQIGQYKILLPPLPEQRAIADMLSSLDAKIELLREQNETLEKTAQTIFQEWFGRYSVENPEELLGNYSRIGLEEIIEFEPREKIIKDKPYIFYDMKCLPTNGMSMDTGEYKVSSSGSSFQVNDTLLAKITPCLENGKTGFVFDTNNEEVARGSTEFIVLRAKEWWSCYFNYCLARSQNFRDHAIKSMTGTSWRQRIQLWLLKNYTMPYSRETMVEFHKTSLPIFEKIKSNSFQIQSLSKTRDTLLPKLMSGEVRV